MQFIWGKSVDATLIGADLTDAKLDKADLRGANLQGAIITGDQLHTVQNFLNAILPGGQSADKQKGDVYILKFDLNEPLKTNPQIIEHVKSRYNSYKVYLREVFRDILIKESDPIQLVDMAFEILDKDLSSLTWQMSLFVFYPDSSMLSGIINPLALKKIFDRTNYWPQILGNDGILYTM